MFQSTRPVRGATHGAGSGFIYWVVSIHAPRAGRDLPDKAFMLLRACFNPRAPCGARRLVIIWSSSLLRFNPRAPCGARLRQRPRLFPQARFNPRAPCGARHRLLCRRRKVQEVSIHAPRAGRDRLRARRTQRVRRFNPRAPCGARRQMRLHPPSFATYLWVLLATNMIFSAFCPTPLLRHGSHTYIFTPYFLFTSPSHSGRMLR